MWDGTPPRSGRGGRGDGPDAGRRSAMPQRPARRTIGQQSANNPYRPYGEATGTRLPAPLAAGASGRYARGAGGSPGASGGGWTSAGMSTAHRSHFGFAIFHDGNPGHLWRGRVASLLGEAMLSVGVIMWLADITYSALAVAFAVIAMGVAFVLAGPVAAPFENVRNPGSGLKWVGRLRALFTVALVAMYFHTMLPVVYLLLFAISLCGRLQDRLRTAAVRTCLAPEEPELVANDAHIGASVVAVAGPLLATLLFVLLGERVLLVDIGSAVLFLIGASSDSSLDVLPPQRRAFLLVTPETAYPEGQMPETGADDEDEEEDNETRRELGLPEWYQQGPTNSAEAVADVRHGLGLAGTSNASSVALWALSGLALVGGGLSVAEVFYIMTVVNHPALYLGPLLAAQGAGLALGTLVTAGATSRGVWRPIFLAGMVGLGVAVTLLAVLPMMIAVVILGLAIGLMNALAVIGARSGLLAGFDGVERRAIAAAEAWVTAACGLVGALFFAVLLNGPQGVPGLSHLPRSLGGLPVDVVLALMGGGLVLGGVAFGILLSTGGKPRRGSKGKAKAKADKSKSKRGERGRLPALDGDEDEDWDDAGGEGWGDEDDDRFAESGYGYTDSELYAQDEFGESGVYEDEDDPRERRGGTRQRRGQDRRRR